MSQRLATCRALAAMLRSHGTLSVDELRFIAHIALELGLTTSENTEVEATIRDGGDYDALVKDITDRPLQIFLFRQVVAAALIDEQINEAEQAFINKTADAFKIPEGLRAAFVSWMNEGIVWERRGAELVEAITMN